jgi:Asp-tRNA(Asn)/Glu-tRNA(Gln) amidotransferase A subunit family amidase
VRAPAAACRVCGIKNSSNFLPRGGICLIDESLDAPGVLAPALDDLAYILEVLGGSDGGETRPFKLLVPERDLNAAEPRVLEAFERAVARLRSQGTRIAETEIQCGRALDARKILSAAAFARFVHEQKLAVVDLPASARAVMLFAEQLDPAKLSNARQEAAALTARLAGLLEQDTFVLTPTLPAPVPRWSALEKPQRGPWDQCNLFLAWANVADLPAVSFPAPATEFGFSLQLVGSRGKDRLLLKTAGLVARALNDGAIP